MKKISVLLAVLALFAALMFTGCGQCKHRWMAADCVSPRICSECNAVEGEALGHNWTEADCVTPKTCQLCKKTEGEALGHTWLEATCTAPKTCSVCQTTEGQALDHSWLDATCTTPATCQLCQQTKGDPAPHSYLTSTQQEPSCAGDGLLVHTCQSCGHSYEETLPATTYSPSEIYDLLAPSVGEIITYDATGYELALGTCFARTEDGQLITNYHVIEGAVAAKVTINGRTYNVEYVLAYDKNIDLAILKINATGLKPVSLCYNTHNTGSQVFAFGSSQGLTNTLSQGIITYAEREIDGVLYIQHDAAISGGNSGGPLINSYGEVIGINTMTIRDSQNLNFAISAKEMENLVFGDPMTLQQVSELEMGADAFQILKEYIINNGTYFSEDGGGYRVLLGADTNDAGTTKFARYAYYYLSDNTITLDMVINDGQYWLYVTIDEQLSGLYLWDYFDENDYKMGGVVYADSFRSDTILDYDYSNIDYDDLQTEILYLASNMVSLLLMYSEYDLAGLGITPASLGFTSF